MLTINTTQDKIYLVLKLYQKMFSLQTISNTNLFSYQNILFRTCNKKKNFSQ